MPLLYSTGRLAEHKQNTFVIIYATNSNPRQVRRAPQPAPGQHWATGRQSRAGEHWPKPITADAQLGGKSSSRNGSSGSNRKYGSSPRLMGSRNRTGQ